MQTAKSIEKVRKALRKQKQKGKTIGFVPTMGALHPGHLSLVRKARKEVDFLVVSIFINPLQFGPKEDLGCYPRNFKKDQALLKKHGVDLVFYPSPKTMYSKDFSTYVEETSLSRGLCARSRPGHFRGVATVVAKLFNIVGADLAYFGQKDYQQAQIIKRMTQDLNFPLKVKVLGIVRQRGGLALSSRNIYLSPAQRKDARVLWQSLQLARQLVKAGQRNSSLIKRRIKTLINSKKSTRIDYIELVDPLTLKAVKKITKTVLLALAVFVGKTRLIDNALIRP